MSALCQKQTSPTELDPDPRHDAPLALALLFRVTALALPAEPEVDTDLQSGLLRLPDHFFTLLARLLLDNSRFLARMLLASLRGRRDGGRFRLRGFGAELGSHNDLEGLYVDPFATRLRVFFTNF